MMSLLPRRSGTVMSWVRSGGTGTETGLPVQRPGNSREGSKRTAALLTSLATSPNPTTIWATLPSRSVMAGQCRPSSPGEPLACCGRGALEPAVDVVGDQLAYLEALQLARGRPGQLTDEDDQARALEVGQSLAAPVDELVLGEHALGHHARHGLGEPVRVREPDDGSLGHHRVLHQPALDLA